MLPDETAIGAGKALIDVGVVGAGLLFAMGALVFVTKRLFAVQDKLMAAVTSHKDDAVKWSGMSEVMKNQMEDQADLMKTTIEILRDRGRA